MLNKAPLMVMTALAMAAGSVAAQSSLQIYGTLDAALVNTKTENTAWTSLATGPKAAASASTTAISSGVMTGSYIGFKGTEDLGGGMEASFVLESYLELDTGAEGAKTSPLSAVSQIGAAATTWKNRDEGGFWGRNAYVSLKTNYGMVRLGQMDSLGYLAAGNYNPFGHASISPSRIFYTTDFYAQGWSNTLGYYIKLGDFVGALQYSPKNDSVANTGAKTSIAVRYTAGPLSTSLGYESNKDNVGTTVPAQAKSWALHGSYDFGVTKLFAQYGVGVLDRTNAAAQDVKSKGFQIGASVPMGNGAFMASYANGKQEADNTAVPGFVSGTEFRDIKIVSVGYDYNLSKRTDVYVAFSKESDDYPVTAANPGVVGGLLNNLNIDTRTLAVGIRHRF